MTIKRIRIKLKNKNKLNDTFIFWQRKEREKREKKKNHWSPTITPPRTCITSMKRG